MLTQVTPSYLYTQYADDSDLQAFVASYNTLAQQYLNWFNNTPLPVYTNSVISGALLDWVGQGVYGYSRPTLATGATFSNLGVYNTEPYNALPYNQNLYTSPVTNYTVTDDYYKRCLTWNFYKGDGFQFTTTWLKRRIYRFLNGVNGTDPGVQQTYSVSVTFSGTAVSVTIPTSFAANILQAGIQAGALYVPFQYPITITLV
jgi:hypothetical protein